VAINVGRDALRKRKVARGGNWLARWWSLLTPAVKKKIITVFLLSMLGAGLLSGGTVVVFRALSRSDFFQISSLKIIDNHEVKKSEIIKLSGLDIYSNLFSLNAEEVKKRIESHDWIEHVVVKKKWPHVLEIIVRERKALAIINTQQGPYYVDKYSTVFARLDSKSDLDYPILTGMEAMVSVNENGVASVSDDHMMKECLRLILSASNGSSSFPRQNISQIHLNKENKLVLFLTDRPFPIYLGEEISSEKFNRLKKVLYFLYKKKEFANVDYIRLDYLENKVLVGKNNS
jgi:cell division septal protein FtsQ